MVLQQMIRGLADDEIQRKLLAKSEMTLGEAEKFVMAEESGKWSQADSRSEPQIAAGLSTYKSQQIFKPKPYHAQCYKFRSALRGMVRSRTISSKLVRFWYAKPPKSGLSQSKTTLSW